MNFYNISNHPVSQWPISQTRATLQLVAEYTHSTKTHLVDISLPKVWPKETPERIDAFVIKIISLIKHDIDRSDDSVISSLIGLWWKTADFALTYKLTHQLLSLNHPVYVVTVDSWTRFISWRRILPLI